ncbi:MAG: biopolymer transporter ExbD [Candidatus Calescibacterium sp.]|nr:biopolymer transporter ExbD [Candidatus Calescibacterium sp.]MCX7733425.1 biopolymer transporter ExbD [bacterium]MDW8087548.1 biopolymer transporter ExbD [Candidatus Calescibacterium sp.]
MDIKKSDEFESQINIIPLVDIMLVLLIIFMLTAPVLKTAFDVELPESSSAQAIEQTDETPTISISEKGTIKINGMVISSLDELEKILSNMKRKDVIIEADKRVDYGRIIEVMDIIRKSGIEKIGLATEHIEKNNTR